MSASVVTPAADAASARERKDEATSAKPFATCALAASGSAGLGSPGGTRGAAWASTTGPTAPPRPTPMPVNSRPDVISALRLRVEIRGEQLDELVEHALGVVPLRGERDLLAVLHPE